MLHTSGSGSDCGHENRPVLHTSGSGSDCGHENRPVLHASGSGSDCDHESRPVFSAIVCHGIDSKFILKSRRHMHFTTLRCVLTTLRRYDVMTL